MKPLQSSGSMNYARWLRHGHKSFVRSQIFGTLAIVHALITRASLYGLACRSCFTRPRMIMFPTVPRIQARKLMLLCEESQLELLLYSIDYFSFRAFLI
jgi:hypothetical protein